MKKNLIRVTAGCAFFFLLLQGCQEQQAGKSDNTGANTDKMAKLIFMQNEELKADIETIQKAAAKCEEEKENLVAKNKELQQTIDKKLEEMINEILKTVMDEQAKLQQENKQLKDQLAAIQQTAEIKDVNASK